MNRAIVALLLIAIGFGSAFVAVRAIEIYARWIGTVNCEVWLKIVFSIALLDGVAIFAALWIVEVITKKIERK